MGVSGGVFTSGVWPELKPEMFANADRGSVNLLSSANLLSCIQPISILKGGDNNNFFRGVVHDTEDCPKKFFYILIVRLEKCTLY